MKGNGYVGVASVGITVLIGVIMVLMFNTIRADTTEVRVRVTQLEKQRAIDSLNMYYTLDKIWTAIQQTFPAEAEKADSIVAEKHNNHNNHYVVLPTDVDTFVLNDTTIMIIRHIEEKPETLFEITYTDTSE